MPTTMFFDLIAPPVVIGVILFLIISLLGWAPETSETEEEKESDETISGSCLGCGQVLDPEDLFCPECGKKVEVAV